MIDPRYVVSEFNRLWEHGDLDGAMSIVADHCMFVVHVSSELVEHAGRWVGADQIRMALATARRHYDYSLYRARIVGLEDDTVQVRVEFLGTHRLSGQQICMTFRQVFVVESGKITRCDEYHDRAKLEAYLTLIQSYPLPSADLN